MWDDSNWHGEDHSQNVAIAESTHSGFSQRFEQFMTGKSGSELTFKDLIEPFRNAMIGGALLSILLKIPVKNHFFVSSAIIASVVFLLYCFAQTIMLFNRLCPVITSSNLEGKARPMADLVYIIPFLAITLLLLTSALFQAIQFVISV